MWWHNGASWGFQVDFSEIQLLIKINLVWLEKTKVIFNKLLSFQAIALISGEKSSKKQRIYYKELTQ